MIALDDIEKLTLEQISALLCRCAAALAMRGEHPPIASTDTEDRLLSADEAGRRLGVDRQWLYRRTRRLPFVVRLEGKVRFSERGIDRYIRSKAKP